MRYNIPNQVGDDECCFIAVGAVWISDGLLLCCYMFRMRCNWILSTSNDLCSETVNQAIIQQARTGPGNLIESLVL